MKILLTAICILLSLTLESFSQLNTLKDYSYNDVNYILPAFEEELQTNLLDPEPLPRHIDSRDLAVMISTIVSENPPSIQLLWDVTDIAQYYVVYKKLKGAAQWQTPAIFTSQTPVKSYTDNDVLIGIEYEYMVIAIQNAALTLQKRGGGDTVVARPVWGFGYTSSGIRTPAKDLNGKLILLVDNTVADALPSEISRLYQDLTGEGWHVVKYNVPRTEEFNGEQVKNNKKLILDEYAKNPSQKITILLLGRVAVPYSGRQNPDGHGDHIGAWPADLYYGSIQENYWTDTQINDVSASRTENHNIPGDGKFDLTRFPKGTINFAVGRIDFYNMPQFPDSEINLIKKYLNKNHNYRIGNKDFEMRGLIDDNFAARTYTEAFASSGWRNLGAFFGSDNVKKIDFFTTMQTDSYMWSYGTGGGTYISAGGIGNTKDFSEKQVNSIFTMLFGSYFGDWDSKDNFLRAPLASEPSALTCVWAGRPPWYFHHLLHGEPIAYSTILSQNEDFSIYMPNGYIISGSQPQVAIAGYQQIHTALMGDPTLKMYMGDKYVAPPKNLTLIQPDGKTVHLEWTAPDAEVDGYYVYRSEFYDGPYTRISNNIIKETSYIEQEILDGAVFYMVRSVKLQETNGGSFYNVSRAGKDAIASIIATDIEENISSHENYWYPNPASDYVYFNYNSNNKIRKNNLSIVIFDAMGRQIKDLINKTDIISGNNTIKWDFRDDTGMEVAPGVFFARVKQSSDIPRTYRIVFVK